MGETRTRIIILGVAAVVLAATVISPALGGPSLRKLIKKEVSKQLRNKQGPAGQPGASFDANATLPSGQTLTGVWFANAGGSGAVTVISFVPHLAADLPAGSVHLVTGTPSAVCPGPDEAAPGHLCVYERVSTLSAFSGIGNPTTGNTGADRRGAQIAYTGTSGGAVGTWAVTAP